MTKLLSFQRTVRSLANSWVLLLILVYDPEPVLQRLDKYFKFKPGLVGDPDFYLGSKLKIMELENSTKC